MTKAEAMKELEAHRYGIVKRNGQVDIFRNHISKEEADKAIAYSDARGYGWTVKRYNDEEMAEFCWFNGWGHGEYGY